MPNPSFSSSSSRVRSPLPPNTLPMKLVTLSVFRPSSVFKTHPSLSSSEFANTFLARLYSGPSGTSSSHVLPVSL